MPKIAFMGAGSTVFAKNVLGDCMLTPALKDAEIALYDIDGERLRDSQTMLENLRDNLQTGASIRAYLGEDQRRDALRGADYVVDAIQVGGYEPSTVIDFEIPKKYGLRQTIADTLGIGGIFRAVRTIPVLLEFAEEMNDVCPDAWFLNYVNPMAMVTGALLETGGINAVGLCHSVQGCAAGLLRKLDMEAEDLRWQVAGINHQAWLLDIKDGNRDLYPDIRQRAAAKSRNEKHEDMVRFEIMQRFGYYLTESSEHSAEYMPYWIKSSYPEVIDRFNIPLDEYPRRCIAQIKKWEKRRDDLVNNATISHDRTREYASYIMEAMETDKPIRIHGNVANAGRLITNLPRRAVVEVPCLVDRNGVTPCHVGDLPEQCAALNRTNVNVQILTIDAAVNRSRDALYQAALLDPHTSAELSVDDTIALCDELIEAHGDYMPDLA